MTELYTLKNGFVIEDPEMSEIMYKIMDSKVHKSPVYTWDDIGTATLMADIYGEEISFCPQNGCWYVWQGCWRKQGDTGSISDRLQTLLNLLMYYCSEVDDDTIEEYRKYVRSIRKFVAMRNVIEVLKTMLRLPLSEMDNNPYLLNTPSKAYDLKTGAVVEDISPFNVTKKTTCSLPDFTNHPCDRWYQFIDEITSHDKEKARFLQRALGYSILGVNREECMFIAYGAKTRNGKGTLFSTIANVLGQDYADSAPVDLICESKTGRTTDFNAPQPALAKLVGCRLVTMSESPQDTRLDAASMKTITGRDTLVTRGLFENSFSFVPQFTLWLNTNHLPAVTDGTVFASNRIWVIEFNEHFGGNAQNKDLKEIFARPENKPTILKWLFDGCEDYIDNGLNPPECVIAATESYSRRYDRVGGFIEDCCNQSEDDTVLRGDLYAAYSRWCTRSENRYHPVGSTTFYNIIETRGYPIMRREDGWFVHGLSLKTALPSTTVKLS